jgi:hypothetical protein
MARRRTAQRNRQRAVPRPNPAPVRAVTSAGGQTVAQGTARVISWRHCAIGLLAGEAALLLVSNLGILIANVAFGPSGGQHADGGIVGVSTLIAVIFGAWLAGRLAGRSGMYQGIVVAVGFIAVGALYQFLHESQLVAQWISAGSTRLIDLGPMDMGSLVTGDLLALFGGTVGGLLSGKR